jgi:hypothetical protein
MNPWTHPGARTVREHVQRPGIARAQQQPGHAVIFGNVEAQFFGNHHVVIK